jgi:hypothetical protein
MKTFLPAFLSLCFATGIVASAQDAPNSAPQEYQAAIRRTSILGTVRENGEKLTFVTDQRAWTWTIRRSLRGTKDITCE